VWVAAAVGAVGATLASCVYWTPWWVRGQIAAEALCARNGAGDAFDARAYGVAETRRAPRDHCDGAPIPGNGSSVSLRVQVFERVGSTYEPCSPTRYATDPSGGPAYGVASVGTPISDSGSCAGPGTFVTVSAHSGWLYTTYFDANHYPLVSQEYQLP
jgi:hypothetical protein